MYDVYNPTTWNQRGWEKYGPFRAITGHVSTLRAFYAFCQEYRHWDFSDGPRPPKMRSLPEEIRETNYGEWHYSFVKTNRWVTVRQKEIETTKKINRLKKRRKQRQYRANEKDYGEKYEDKTL